MGLMELKDKISIALFLKCAYDIDESALDLSLDIDTDISLDIYLDEVTGMLLGKRENNYCYLETTFQDENEEFEDYTGLMIYEFPHPTIYDFFKEIEKIKETSISLYNNMVDGFDERLLNLLRESFYSDIFNEFYRDEKGIISGLKFTYSSLDNPFIFFSLLMKLIKYLKRCLKELKAGVCDA